jgi:glycosyltransferase involved in cell wall biosynthesis
LNITSVTPFFLPVIGGVETVIYETGVAFTQSGHRYSVLTSRPAGTERFEIMSGVEVYREESLYVPPSGNISPVSFDSSRVADVFNSVLTQTTSEIVHLHNYQMKSYAMFLYAFLRNFDQDRAILITIHNDFDDEFSQYVLKYAPFSKVIVPTRKAAFDLIEGGVTPSKLVVIPNMINSNKFRKAKGKSIRDELEIDDEPLILFPSRLVGREGNIFRFSDGKGLETLLRAFPLIREEVPKSKILLLGNDPIHSDVVQAVQKECAAALENVGVKDGLLYFNRYIPHEELPEVFAASDVVVSLSPREAFGMVFLEAMAAGKPVIGANSGMNGVPEIVPDGKAGYLVPVADPLATARTCTKILNDPDLGRRLGFYGAKWVQEKFDSKIVLPKLLSEYEMAVRRKKPVSTVLQYN